MSAERKDTLVIGKIRDAYFCHVSFIFFIIYRGIYGDVHNSDWSIENRETYANATPRGMHISTIQITKREEFNASSLVAKEQLAKP